MSNIAAILLDNLQKIDMSVYEFSKRLGIPKGRIYQWTRGNGSPKVEDVPVLIKRKSKKTNDNHNTR